MRKDRLMKVLVLFTVGLISTCLYAANEVSQQGIPTKGMVITKVHLGEMVKKGQLLYTLELTPFKIQEDIDTNDLFYADLIYKRDVKLHNKHALSFKDLWSAKTAYLTAVAKLKTQQLKIKRFDAKAPFDGEVTKIETYTGSAVPDGEGAEVEITNTDKPIAITKPAVAEVMNRFEQPIVMKVKLGQKVKKGQLLFYTDLEKYKIALDHDKTQLKVDKNTFKEVNKAYSTHAMSYDQYENARKVYNNAIDAVKTDMANIKDSKCYSPFDGTVTKIVAYTGSTLGSASEVVDVTQSPK